MASECDCFLIRQEHQSLFLSLHHQKSVHHVNIQYGPDGYKLENGSAKDSFAELDDLVAYYREHSLNKIVDTKLGAMCEKSLTLLEQTAAHSMSSADKTTSINAYASVTKPATPPPVHKSIRSSGNYNSLSVYKWGLAWTDSAGLILVRSNPPCLGQAR